MSNEKKLRELLDISFLKLRQTEQELAYLKGEQSIAIIGMDCQFPGGANSPEAFWTLLQKGQDGTSEVPKTRWDINQYYDPDPEAPGKINSTRGGFLKRDIQTFDAAFFNISPKEAQSLDPQQRLLLETTWHALERSTISARQIRGSQTGVYIGISANDYATLQTRYQAQEEINAYLGTGNALSVAAGRIAYMLGLQGPTVSIDTACSSSLVALHLACQSLRQGEINMAIVGGVNLLLSPDNTIVFTKAHMLAADGHCKTFDEKADGYVRGEGCGIVILKRLSDAQKDKNTILAIIKGSAVNQDGASSGLTVPNGAAQEKLIRQALEQAHITGDTIDYVEAHGTGTKLGDPIEVRAISKVLSRSHSHAPLIISSAKTYIGHLEAAAGIAGLIKTVLSLQHDYIPRHRNFTTLNPLIELEHIPAIIPTEGYAWPKQAEKQRRAGVSSFGFSGTNAHIILEEAPIDIHERAIDENPPAQFYFSLSAKTETALENYIQCYIDFLKQPENARLNLGDICYTLQTGRELFSHAIVVTAKTTGELLEKLTRHDFSSDIKDIPVLDSQYYHTINLPTYPFERQTYWLQDITPKIISISGEKTAYPLWPAKTNLSNGDKVLDGILDLNANPYLRDHQVFETVIFPGAGFIDAFLSVQQTFELDTFRLENLILERPLHLGEQAVRVQVVARVQEEAYQLTLYHEENKEWVLHASANLVPHANAGIVFESIDDLRAQCSQAVSIDSLYETFARHGLQYGLAFQAIKTASKNENNVLVSLDVDKVSTSAYVIHPALLDGAFQALALLANEEEAIYLPWSMGNITYSGEPNTACYGFIQLTEKTPQQISADISLLDQHGRVMLTVKHFVARRTHAAQLKQLIHPDKITYVLPEWEKIDTPEPRPLTGQWQVLQTSTNNVLVDELKTYLPDVAIIENATLIDASNSQGLFYPVDASPEQAVNLIESATVLIQTLLKSNPSPQLIFLTQGLYAGNNLAAGSLLGFIKSVLQEYPLMIIRLVDTDDVSVLQRLPEAETFLAYVQGVFYRHRLRASSTVQLALPPLPYALISDAGELQLRTVSDESIPLGDHELELVVHATGLNFRDVLNHLGLYPGDPGPLGGEAAGVVKRIGSKVTRVKPGDRVFGEVMGGFRTYARTQETLLAPLLASINYAQGAGLSVVFLTVYYALVIKAKIKAGDRVLIHAATGGVGLAAIQLAKHYGAEIYATTSLPKQAFLRSLGIEHIYDSRTSNFGKQILDDTQQIGVDTVLNSLTSEGFIDASLSCLKQGGTFLEIGKRNIYTLEDMQAARPDVHYHIIAIDTISQEAPQKIANVFDHLQELLAKHIITPLPAHLFPIERAPAAFTLLQQAKHIGKVIITQPVPLTEQLQPDATYLITGGLGALGQVTLTTLLQHGAKQVILLGRQAPREEMRQQLDSLEKQYKARIETKSLDISDEHTVKQLMQALTSQNLKGIFHAAGQLEDKLLPEQNSDSIRRVFLPKAQAAWYLHHYAQINNMQLDYFVLFSSIAASMGSPGQTNYAAANSFLDQLAIYRHQHGLAATSINWGSWSIGMAKSLTATHAKHGLMALSKKDGMQALAYCLQQSQPVIQAADIEWALLAKNIGKIPDWLSELVDRAAIQTRGSLILLLEQAPKEQQEAVLKNEITTLVRSILGLSANQAIDEHLDFFAMGMDSLMITELRNRLQMAMGETFHLTNTFVFEHASITSLLEALPKIEIKEQQHKKISDKNKEECLNIFDLRTDCEAYIDCYESTSKKIFNLTGNLISQVKHLVITIDNDAQIECLLYGQGKPLVYIPGTYVNMNMALLQLKNLPDELLNTHQFILINPPGIGRTHYKYIDNAHRYIHDILNRLAANHQTILISYSLGALTALSYLVQANTSVEKALFFVPPSPYEVKAQYNDSAANEMLTSALKNEANQYQVAIPALYSKAFLPAQNENEYLKSIGKNIGGEDFSNIHCPIFTVYAKHDSIVNIEKSSDFYRKQLACTAESEIFVDAGHFLFHTHQKLFLDIIKHFLKGDKLQ